MKRLMLAAALIALASTTYRRAELAQPSAPQPDYTPPASETPYQRGLHDYNTGRCFRYGPFFDDTEKTRAWLRGYDDAAALDHNGGSHCPDPDH